MLQQPGAATLRLSSKATTLHPHGTTEPKEEEEDDVISFMSASSTTNAMATLRLPRLDELSKGGETFAVIVRALEAEQKATKDKYEANQQKDADKPPAAKP